MNTLPSSRTSKSPTAALRSLKTHLKALGFTPTKYLANLANKLFRQFRVALKRQWKQESQPIYSKRAIDTCQQPVWPGQGLHKTNRHFTRDRVRIILKDNGLYPDYQRFLSQFFDSSKIYSLAPELEEPEHIRTLLHYFEVVLPFKAGCSLRPAV